MTPNDNPFASPLADAGVVAADDIEVSDARRIRREYLEHETSVRSIGALYYIGAVCLVALAVYSVTVFTRVPRRDVAALLIGSQVVKAGLAVLLSLVGWRLRNLDRRVRIPVGLLSVVGMFLFFPFGALINAYILYIVCGSRSKMLFSEQYQEVIQLTPDMRCQTSWRALILLAVLVGVLRSLMLGS